MKKRVDLKRRGLYEDKSVDLKRRGLYEEEELT